MNINNGKNNENEKGNEEGSCNGTQENVIYIDFDDFYDSYDPDDPYYDSRFLKLLNELEKFHEPMEVEEEILFYQQFKKVMAINQHILTVEIVNNKKNNNNKKNKSDVGNSNNGCKNGNNNSNGKNALDNNSNNESDYYDSDSTNECDYDSDFTITGSDVSSIYSMYIGCIVEELDSTEYGDNNNDNKNNDMIKHISKKNCSNELCKDESKENDTSEVGNNNNNGNCGKNEKETYKSEVENDGNDSREYNGGKINTVKSCMVCEIGCNENLDNNDIGIGNNVRNDNKNKNNGNDNDGSECTVLTFDLCGAFDVSLSSIGDVFKTNQTAFNKRDDVRILNFNDMMKNWQCGIILSINNVNDINDNNYSNNFSCCMCHINIDSGDASGNSNVCNVVEINFQYNEYIFCTRNLNMIMLILLLIDTG